MKKFLLATVALVALGATVPALAADLAARPYNKAPAYAAPIYNWTGFYVGINGGGGWGRSQWDGVDKFDVSGGLIGATIGYNWQFAPAWVAGVEADFDAADIEGMANASTGFGAASAGTKLDWFGTVRARAGVLVTPHALLYATGGWAYGHTTTSANATLTGVAAASTSIGVTQSNGWTAGAGLEYAFNPWLSFKTEYLFLDLGTDSLVNGTVAGVPFSVSEKTTVHAVKAGINVKFGGW